MECSVELNMVSVNKLKARKENLEAKIKEKSLELKNLCIAEAELTGTMPVEIPLEPDESPPPIRRRVGTMYPYTDDVINRLISSGKRNDGTQSPKRKQPFGSWDINLLKSQEDQIPPAYHTWSPQRNSPKKKKTASSRSNSYISKLKMIKKW